MTLRKDGQENTHEVIDGNMGGLGAEKEPDGICFRIAQNGTQPVSLLLYSKGSDQVVQEILLTEKRLLGDVYGIKVLNLDYQNYEYNYRVGEKIIQDPYAHVITGRKTFGQPTTNEDGHQIRCGFDFARYDWQGDLPLEIPYEDAVMYSLHVRGFTRQENSKVRHKGTFSGLEEKAEYLKRLGVNQVKLMPAYEFDEIISPCGVTGMSYQEPLAEKKEKINFWGYEEGWYFAPKASYASGSDPVKEMKDMVRTLHKKGIEVLMELYFPKSVSYRLAADCMLHWITQYHVDGFLLVGSNTLLTSLAKDPLFTKTKILGEYFPPEEIYPNNQIPSYRNLGEYNDGFLYDMRRILSGEEKQMNDFAYRIHRNPSHSGVINYIVDHNGFTLMDLVSYDEKHNEANGEQNQDGSTSNYSWNCGIEGPTRRRKILELRSRQMKNAFLMMLLASGTPMLHAGDELGNSQEGNNNPYCQDNEISWVNWKNSKRGKELTEFVGESIAFRKRHKVLHMKKELRIMDTLSCGYPDLSYHGNRAWYGGFENSNRQIGIMYCGQYADEDNFIYVAYNLYGEENEFALPHLPEGMKWYTAIDTSFGIYKEGEEPALEAQKMFTVPGHTIIVLIGRK